MRVLFLYGSQTGAAESIAEALSVDAVAHGFESKLARLNDFNAAGVSLASADPKVVVMVCSTTGNGEPPTNCEDFYRYIRRRTHPKTLMSSVQFCMLGLGNTNYDKFCHASVTIRTQMLAVGATEFMASVSADESLGLETFVEPWKVDLWRSLAAFAAAPAASPPAAAATASAAPLASAPAAVAAAATTTPPVHPSSSLSSPLLPPASSSSASVEATAPPSAPEAHPAPASSAAAAHGSHRPPLGHPRSRSSSIASQALSEAVLSAVHALPSAAAHGASAAPFDALEEAAVAAAHVVGLAEQRSRSASAESQLAMVAAAAAKKAPEARGSVGGGGMPLGKFSTAAVVGSSEGAQLAAPTEQSLVAAFAEVVVGGGSGAQTPEEPSAVAVASVLVPLPPIRVPPLLVCFPALRLKRDEMPPSAGASSAPSSSSFDQAAPPPGGALSVSVTASDVTPIPLAETEAEKRPFPCPRRYSVRIVESSDAPVVAVEAGGGDAHAAFAPASAAAVSNAAEPLSAPSPTTLLLSSPLPLLPSAAAAASCAPPLNKQGHSFETPVASRLVSARYLTQGGATAARRVLEVALDVTDTPLAGAWDPGDAIGVIAPNAPEVVSALCARLGLDPTSRLLIAPIDVDAQKSAGSAGGVRRSGSGSGTSSSVRSASTSAVASASTALPPPRMTPAAAEPPRQDSFFVPTTSSGEPVSTAASAAAAAAAAAAGSTPPRHISSRPPLHAASPSVGSTSFSSVTQGGGPSGGDISSGGKSDSVTAALAPQGEQPSYLPRWLRDVLSAEADGKSPNPAPTVADVFTWCVDVSSRPEKAFLKMLSTFCKPGGEGNGSGAAPAADMEALRDADQLSFLASVKGKPFYESWVEGQRLGLLDLLSSFPSCRPDLGALLSALPTLKPRFYSLACSPLTRAGLMRFAFTTVEYECGLGVDASAETIMSPRPVEASAATSPSSATAPLLRRRGLATSWLEAIAQPFVDADPAAVRGMLQRWSKSTASRAAGRAGQQPAGVGAASAATAASQLEATEAAKRTPPQQHIAASGDTCASGVVHGGAVSFGTTEGSALLPPLSGPSASLTAAVTAAEVEESRGRVSPGAAGKSDASFSSPPPTLSIPPCPPSDKVAHSHSLNRSLRSIFQVPATVTTDAKHSVSSFGTSTTPGGGGAEGGGAYATGSQDSGETRGGLPTQLAPSASVPLGSISSSSTLPPSASMAAARLFNGVALTSSSTATAAAAAAAAAVAASAGASSGAAEQPQPSSVLSSSAAFAVFSPPSSGAAAASSASSSSSFLQQRGDPFTPLAPASAAAAVHAAGARSPPLPPIVRIFKRDAKDFKVPANTEVPLIMVGPGTGVAPFVGFLEHRQRRIERDEKLGGAVCRGLWRGGCYITSLREDAEYYKPLRLGPAHLFFGNRHRDVDFLYRDEMQGYLKDGALSRLETAFSRESADEKVYVQQRILENGPELADLILNKGAHVYICGDGAKMARDVDGAFATILKQHDTAGKLERVNFSPIAATDASLYMKAIKEQLGIVYLKDVWS